jgi:hypothetical protein
LAVTSRLPAVVLVVAALAGCERDGGGGGLWVPPAAPVPLTTVSGSSPFAQGCDQQAASGTLYAGSEVEPFLAINPVSTDNRVAVWQQDRWSNGGARGLLAGVSFDGGDTWSTRAVPFSRCTGGTLLNGGDYARATDPWVSFGPTGTAYWMAMTITGSRSAMRVSRSLDGGDTWQAPITLIDNDNPYFNDKNSLTADPTDAAYAYAVWDRLDSATNRGPTFFARTVDGGASWEAARSIYDPGTDAQTIGNVIAVLPGGTVLNLFTELPASGGAFLKVIRSTDKGATWSAPVQIGQMLAVGVRDPVTLIPVRSGSIIASFAVGPGDEVWAAWQDSRYSAPGMPVRDGVVLAHSDNGGLNWDTPVLVSPDDTQAFTPAVHVATDGTVGVSYYDFRDDVRRDSYLLTGHWLALSSDGTAFDERRISGPFDLDVAPNALGLFLGDYTGLASDAFNFVPLFAQTRPSLAERTDLYTVTLPILELAKSTGRRYAAPRAPAPELTPEWSALVRANIDRARHHFYERPEPRPPRYVPPP